MDNTSQAPSVPEITPVPAGIHRPFWSVMIPTYNCAHYLRYTLESVLSQDPGPDMMQIEVVDDCSTRDDPAAVVQALGQGRVGFYRHPQNIGAQANFTSCIQRATGYWVHILHGDDLVKPGFYDRFYQVLEHNFNIGAAFCNYIAIDQDNNIKYSPSPEEISSGILNNWLERIASQQVIRTPSIIVKRRVYEHLGGFHPELFHTADWEMWVRIATQYLFWYESDALVSYREHAESDTSRLLKSGKVIADSRRAIEIFQSYLPTNLSEKIANPAREKVAHLALELAQRFLKQQNIETTALYIEEAMLCSNSVKILQLSCNKLRQLSRLASTQQRPGEAFKYIWNAIQLRPLDYKNYQSLFKTIVKSALP